MQILSEIYEKLYHYTSWDGLLGILRDKTLWATHYKFLNDYSEIVFFRDKLVSLLIPIVREEFDKLIKQSPQDEQRIIQKGGLSQVVQHDTEVVVDNLYRATDDEIYILSFCGHKKSHVNNNGLLSQWRGYGAGGGFVLVFNTLKLGEMLEIEAKKFKYNMGHLSDLIYSDNENNLKEELSEDLSIIARAVMLFFHQAGLSEKEFLEEVEKAYEPFVRCITRYKHCGFSEENEVRAVLLPTIVDQRYLEIAKEKCIPLQSQPEKERKFRLKNGQLIPYITLFNSIDIDLPIEKIIVGPHKEKETRAAVLRMMLKDRKIDIVCSDIPYVG